MPCSGPKCPCIHPKSRNAQCQKNPNTYKFKQNSSPTTQQKAQVQFDAPSPLTHARSTIIQKRINQRQPTGWIRQPADQNQADSLGDRDSSHEEIDQILVNLQEKLKQLINSLSAHKIQQLKLQVKPPNAILLSMYSVLSFFAGIDKSVPVDLLDKKEVPWPQIQKLISTPQNFQNLLHSFDQNIDRITSKNIEASNYWINKISQNDLQKLDLANQFVEIAKLFKQIVEHQGLNQHDDQGDQEEEEEEQENNYHNQHQQNEEYDDNTDQDEPSYSQITPIEHPSNQKQSNSLVNQNQIINQQPKASDNKTAFDNKNIQPTISSQPPVALNTHLGQGHSAVNSIDHNNHDFDARSQDTVKIHDELNSYDDKLYLEKKINSKLSHDFQTATPTTAKKQISNEEPVLGKTPETKKKNYSYGVFNKNTQKKELKEYEQYGNEAQRLRQEIILREKQIEKIKQQENYLEWLALKEARQSHQKQEEEIQNQSIEWNTQQRLLQNAIDKQQFAEQRQQHRENRDFSFELSAKLSHKFNDEKYLNPQFIAYLEKYASKYDDDLSKQLDYELEVKSLRSELKSVDYRKSQHESYFESTKSRMSEKQK